MRTRPFSDALPWRRNRGRQWWPEVGEMVVTRSARLQARSQATRAESSGQKNSPKRVQEQLKGRMESPFDDSNTAESQSNRKPSLIPKTPKTPKTGKRKSRTAGSLPEMNKPTTDGETSEAESNCSVFELQDSILRVTRRRQILVARDPLYSGKKRLKVNSVSESHTEEVSEAESHVSGISRIVPSTRTRSTKAKSLIDPSQDSHAETISDAESSCSDISTFPRIATRRTTRIMQRKLRAHMEEKDTKIIPGNENQMINTSMDSEDSDTRQTSYLRARLRPRINKPDFSNNEIYSDFDDSFHEKSGKKLFVQEHQHLNKTEEKQVNVVPLKEIKQSCKSLDEENKGMIDKGKEINEKNSEVSVSEIQDNSLPWLISQRHSTPHNNKNTSRPSNQNCEAIMKSLAQTYAVVEIDRWTEERKSTIKTSELTSSNDGSGEEACTIIAASKDSNEERDVDFECDTELCKSELTSQGTGSSVLLLLSSDESQQSENSEIEEDTVCFVEDSAQKGSLNGDSGSKSCDNALFVIDTTPGLSTGKNFYLGEEDKANEGAIEEEKEGDKEDEKSEDEPSDEDKNKDEFSDEDDLLNDTKSKLLKLTSSSIDTGLSIKQLGGLYINFNADKLQSNKKTLTQIKEKKKNEMMQKAIITPDFEKNYCVPPYRESKYQLQKKRREERQKTAGDGWFGMKAPELTDELKNDLKALKMRAAMDPKRFYKKNDRDGFPKYFQIGTIVDNPADFYHSRIPKKQRKKTIVEELLADSEFRRFNRRKYSEIMAEKMANAAGKKFRKKKKFRN